MVQILERQPGFAEKLGMGLSKAVPDLVGGIQDIRDKKQEDESIKNKFGIDLSGIKDAKTREQLINNHYKALSQQQKQAEKFQEKVSPLASAYNRIQRQRELLATGHLGPKISQGLFGLGMVDPDVRKSRAEYEQLGKSLISLASTIPIRNQIEFETLANNLYDPTMTEAQIEGTLDAMERIIGDSLKEYGVETEGESSSVSKSKKSLEDIFGG